MNQLSEKENIQADFALCAALWLPGISEPFVRSGQRRCPADSGRERRAGLQLPQSGRLRRHSDQ